VTFPTLAQARFYSLRVEVNPPPWPDFKEHWTAPASEYRVTIWEQPELQDVEADMIGWGEVTFDLVGVQDVHEAIQWVEEQLAANEGPYSRSGTRVRDREYVLYAKVPDEDRFLQIAGWDPTVNAAAEPPYNLRRRRRPAP
jgi:hypothetical protein